MLVGKSVVIVAAIISIFCILSGQGGDTNIHVQFAENDEKASEDNLFIQVIVQVKRARDLQKHNFTLTVIPLTVTQYKADPDKYGMSCDYILTSEVDHAEEKDFSSKVQVETAVTPDDVAQSEIYFNVSLNNDTIEERDEYFLLVLDIQQPDVINVANKRQCMMLTIITDEDSCELLYEQNIMEVSEDIGEIELLRVSKQGQTELPVTIYISGNLKNDTLIVSPTIITLQPNETSAVVNATIIDDLYPEDDFTHHIHMSSKHGSQDINLTILDNDYVEIGFDETDVTVVEGETVLLNVSFKNNITSRDYRRSIGFSVSIHHDNGNATGKASSGYTVLKYFHPKSGKAIEIPTVNNNILEGTRQFEVRLMDPTPNKFTMIDPDRVIITVRDNDGIPNQPRIGNITFNDGTIILSWYISTNELQPIEKYTITIQIIGSRNRVSKSTMVKRQFGEDEVHQIDVNLAEIKCKLNPSSRTDHCEYRIQQEVKPGETYNITLCAKNEFGETCQSSISFEELRTAAPLDRADSGVPQSTIIGIVIGVLVAVLLFCVLMVCLVFWSVIAPLTRRKDGKEIEKIDNEGL